MSGIRAQQKEKTRQAIINAALNQLSANQSFVNLSLREVAREAGIAPTSFYRHFKDMEELGLSLVDECGVTLRQLMRSARKRFDDNTSIIAVSVETFMEFVEQNPNIFRLLLRERSGTSKLFRDAIAREVKHFTEELADYLHQSTGLDIAMSEIQADALVTITFNNGAEYLDASAAKKQRLIKNTIIQLRFIAHGAASYVKQSE
ncbi:HTH-type transcriptional repressor FabR [Pleionea mediterranea]|jgi:AcrR family transcriptional regulator|uniref:TetR family transcriptional regulator n=1 Tax=Pleionea mediterranea TaxID=523701 RepID=A0A316FXI2_9GAMM|nr:HTH-type transcriptional repressor FabR [Pleionea mediterranea]PWK53289.1 TetR family transcriptional regulator [Pleionea mediterranea]